MHCLQAEGQLNRHKVLVSTCLLHAHSGEFYLEQGSSEKEVILWKAKPETTVRKTNGETFTMFSYKHNCLKINGHEHIANCSELLRSKVKHLAQKTSHADMHSTKKKLWKSNKFISCYISMKIYSTFVAWTNYWPSKMLWPKGLPWSGLS